MKKIFFVLVGALALGLVAYFVLGFVAGWYAPRYIKNDEDISTAYLAFLCIVGVAVVVGGICGSVLHKNLTQRSSGRAPAGRV